jgi:IclR family acetate operon transcriptional repressor
MIRRMKIVKGLSPKRPEASEPAGDTPTMRLFGLLEVMAAKDQRYSLQGLVEETGLPKPTLHRMLQQLEGAGLLQREGDGRHYGIGTRLRRLSENLLFNDSLHGARHTVLRQLVEEIGESCNLTSLSGSEVVYLDRVETAAPLRFYLHPGSRVPVHCSASGKIFLSQMSAAQRRRLLSNAPLETYTAKTLTDPEALEKEVQRVRKTATRSTTKSSCPACCASPRWCLRATRRPRTSASRCRRRSCGSTRRRRRRCCPHCNAPRSLSRIDADAGTDRATA